MTEQYVIESQTKQFLRCKQRHPCLFRSSVTFTLVAFYTRGDQVGRSAFAALCPRQYVVERQVFGMTMLAAILAAVTVANVNACPLHRRLGTIAANVDVMTKPDHGRHGENSRGRVKNIVAVVFLDINRAAKPKADSTSNSDSAERLV